MSDFFDGQHTEDEIVVATIGNQKNPAQVVEIVHLPKEEMFITRGVTKHFKIKEIAVPQAVMIGDIHVMTRVLSYILERIATAADLNLPFRYEPEFELENVIYTLGESGDYMLLTHNN